MWPYIIRVNTKALALMTLSMATLFVFWYYLLVASKERITASMMVSNVDLKQLLIASVVASTRGGQQVVRIRQNNDLKQKSKGKTREGVDDVLTQGDLSSHRAMVHSLSAAFPGLRIISEEHLTEEKEVDIIPIQVTNEMLDAPEYSQVPIGLQVPISQLNVWVDPLDATKEYSEGLTQYVTTMVCVARNGVPIIGVIHKPFTSETYWSLNSKYLSKNIISALSSGKRSNDTFRAIVSRSHAGNVRTLIQTALSKQYKNIDVVSAAGSGYKTIELINNKADAYVHMTLIKKWDICAPNAIINSIDSAHMTTLGGHAITYQYDQSVNNEDGLIASVNQDHNHLVKLLAQKP